jgi:hypothetical protein
VHLKFEEKLTGKPPSNILLSHPRFELAGISGAISAASPINEAFKSK